MVVVVGVVDGIVVGTGVVVAVDPVSGEVVDDVVVTVALSLPHHHSSQRF